MGRQGAAAMLSDEGEVVVACCFFEPLIDADGATIPGAAHLSGVAVEPRRSGHGLATALLERAEAAAHDHGYRRIQLHVLAHPEGPQAVYDKTVVE